MITFRQSASPIVSWNVLCLVVGACVAGAFFFVPDQAEMVSRWDKDGDVARLKEFTKKALEDQRGLMAQTDVQRMRAWLHDYEQDAPDAAVVEEMRIMCTVTDAPAEVGNELVLSTAKITGEPFRTCMEALVRRALGMERPAEAGLLLTQLCHRMPKWETAMRAVQAWRWAVRPDEALKELDLAVADGLKEQECPEAFNELRIKLALESNQPNIAFDIVLRQYQTAPLTQRASLLHRVVEMANTGDRTTEAAALVAAYLANLPYHSTSMDEAIKAVQTGHAFARPADEAVYREYATLLARWAEWGNRGDESFDLWLHLALLDSDEAWERVQDLYLDVERQDEFAKLLSFRISKGLSTDKVQLLADLLAEAGRLDEAVEQYHKALPGLTNPVPAHRWLARVYQEMGRWDDSMAEFGIVLQAQPADAEAQKGRAYALVRLHRYEEACTAYVKVAREQPEDADLQETCAGLCDSLGRIDETCAATKRLLACPGRPTTPEDYLELADQYRLADHENDFIDTLRTALKRYPDTLRIRITLAEALGQNGEHDEAVRLLALESLRSNGEAMDLLINEAMEAQDTALAETFLGWKVPDCLHDLPVTLMKLASLFDHLNRPELSTSIIAGLLNDFRFRQGDTWLTLGRMCLDAGEETKAESFATLYLSSSGANNSKGWELLGDIYQSEERTAEAMAAYSKAVEVVHGPAVPPIERSAVKVSQRISVLPPADARLR